MKLRTEIILPDSNFKIEHYNKILTIGSCFAENISDYFSSYRFNILSNPFGVLYNPQSILNSLKLVYENKTFKQDDLFFHNGEWHSFFHHSDFSHHEPEVCINRINKGIEDIGLFLPKCNVAIITYGTSYVYGHKEKGIVVSNCHKLPASQFVKYRLSIRKSHEIINETIRLLKIFNSNIHIILTVSPVRHWQDGPVENQLSKSTLLLAVNDITGSIENCSYFPSYEIMMDDLRDYRFYDIDLVHPNAAAIEYIWEKFSKCYLSRECGNIMEETIKIDNARRHRVRNKYSAAHIKFIQGQIEHIKYLLNKYPHLELNDDLEYFIRQKEKE